mmetsp:Transcript_22921/g.41615  ORF Transcript_22921/g.41615 Transcript_22921/m.41615 type:complete len:465 (-) Transcript_22921:42-1436(-)
MVPGCCGRQTPGRLLVSVLTFALATDLPTLAAGFHRQSSGVDHAAKAGGLKTGTEQLAESVAAVADSSSASEASVAGDKTGAESASASGVIPEWRLKQTDGLPVFNPKPLIYTYKEPLPPVASTPAQDTQRCPLLKIPDNISLAARSKTWYRLNGDIDTKDGMTIATWSQNLLTYDWRKVDIYNSADGSRSVRARILTDQEMVLAFGWKAPKPAANATKVPLLPANYPDLKSTSNIALLDCDGRLTYVVTQDVKFPYKLTVYNAEKKLLASTIVDTTIMRYQFVDPESGYLIATAEAPDIGFLISRRKLPQDAALGYVPPFGIKFEKGGYTNSSRLMEIDYRWVILAAVEVSAINLAEQIWYPKTAQTVLDLLWGVFFFLIAVGICYMLYYIYATVFPPVAVVAERNLVYKGRAKDVTEVSANPFLAVPSVSSLRPKLTSAPAFSSPGYVDYRTMYEPTGLHGN